MQTKGAPEAIEIVIKNLPKNFEEIEHTKKELKNINLEIVNSFAKNAEFIMNMVGADTVRGWIKDKEDLNSQIAQAQKEMEVFEKEKSAIHGELEQLFSYLNALKKNLGTAETEIAEDKKRINEIHELNAKAQKNIDAIPDTISVTETTYGRRGWWFFRNYQTTIVKNVKNPDKDAAANFIQGLILSRCSHISAIASEKERIEEKKKEFWRRKFLSLMVGLHN